MHSHTGAPSASPLADACALIICGCPLCIIPRSCAVSRSASAWQRLCRDMKAYFVSTCLRWLSHPLLVPAQVSCSLLALTFRLPDPCLQSFTSVSVKPLLFEILVLKLCGVSQSALVFVHSLIGYLEFELACLLFSRHHCQAYF